MRIDYSKAFIKQLKKCPYEVQVAFRKRLGIFLVEKNSPLLRNHALIGILKNYRSINITGDWRALFCEIEGGCAVRFEILGTHSELYS